MRKNTADDASGFDNETTFVVTHPFSPFSGQRFTLKQQLIRGGVAFLHFETKEGNIRSIRKDWTDYKEPNELEVPMRKAFMDVESLIKLNDLLIQLQKQ